MIMLVTLRIRYLSNTVQVFIDFIYVHCLIEKLNICILLGGKLNCRLLPSVTDLLPGELIFSKRFLKHFVTGYCKINSMVSTVCRSSMCNVSRLGNNIRDVCFKNDIDFHSLHTVSIGEINNKIMGK